MNPGQTPINSVSSDSVAASLVSGMISGLTENGIDGQACAIRADITTAVLAEPTARIEFLQFARFIDEIASVSADEALGIRLGSQLAISSFSALGYAAASCECLHDALLLIPAFEAVVMTRGKTEIVVEQGYAQVCWSMTGGHSIALLEDLFLASWITSARLLTGQDGLTDIAAFSHPKPKDIRPWQRMFGERISFSQPLALLRFPADILQTEILKADPFLKRVMVKEAQDLTSSLQPKTVTEMASQWLLRQLDHGDPGQKALASSLNLSERTLRRRLQQENSSYQKILDAARRDKATYYLTQTSMPLLEISMRLGYQQLTAFNAAYKRWTGNTPGAVRQSDFNNKLTPLQ